MTHEEFMNLIWKGVREADNDPLFDRAPQHDRFIGIESCPTQCRRYTMVTHCLFRQVYNEYINVNEYGSERLRHLVPLAKELRIGYRPFMDFLKDIDLTLDQKRIIGEDLVKYLHFSVYPPRLVFTKTGKAAMSVITRNDHRELIRDGYIDAIDYLVWWPDVNPQPTNEFLYWLITVCDLFERTPSELGTLAESIFNRSDWLLPTWFYQDLARYCKDTNACIDKDKFTNTMNRWIDGHSYVITRPFLETLHRWFNFDGIDAHLRRSFITMQEETYNINEALKAIDITGYIDKVEAYITSYNVDAESRKMAKTQYKNMMRLALYCNNEFVAKYGGLTVQMLTFPFNRMHKISTPLPYGDENTMNHDPNDQ